jgi:hypothetical protein
MFVLAEVIVSYFGKPPSQKGLGVPSEAKFSNSRMAVLIGYGKFLASARRQFSQNVDSRVINFDARERYAVPTDLIEGNAMPRLLPDDRIPLNGSGFVRNAHIT